ncbi:hypothetical protein [Epibacterium sp. Ofav1-8]|uniref:hypothetical protein n=1 Tax=Epibacterium sp. Ofav1-8 TaxID=2917735 RepID=UPI001EF3DC46|nr:hypothetical protein [Epibacterium sp. Ofav1-8]MCG7623216.1 hypothetical protein [Epibacterium sp. Ofav1-8]
METRENACYQSAQTIEKLVEHPDTTKLSRALDAEYPEVGHSEARLRILSTFDDAIAEASLIPSLPEQHVASLISEIRNIQYKILMALAQDTVQGFKSHARHSASVATLNLVGHTLAASKVARHEVFDRNTFLDEAQSMLSDTRAAPINPMQKAVLELKLKSIIRIMHECEGATDDQIRRRLKNIFADIQAEFEEIDDEQKEFIEKFRDWVSKSMKSSAFTLGLTADTLSVLSIAGPVAAAAMLASAESPLMIEGPSADAPAETIQTPE